MKPLKVLSIDWDYLVNATTTQRMRLFPDGGSETLPVMVQDIVWSSRYGENEELEKIGVDIKALELLKKFILKTCSKSTYCMVYDSHKWCFDEVISRLHSNQSIEVVNIDYHHDLYRNDFLNEVDCGNWVNCLFETNVYRNGKKSDKYYWVHRKDSDMLSEPKEYVKTKTIEELSTLEGFEFDLLFICRSSVWSPPHLDKGFIEFYQWIDKNITRAEVNITGSRYTEEFKHLVEQYRATVNELKKSMKNKREVI